MTSAGVGHARRESFTLIEVIIALVVFAILAMVLVDLLTSESRNTSLLMDDLTLNKDARAILQAISRDVRSATSFGPFDSSQQNPEAGLICVDNRLARLVLVYQAPAVDAGSQDLKRFQVEYRVIDRGQTPPSTLPAARPRPYRLSGGSEVAVVPVVRQLSVLTGASATPQLQDAQIVGWVRFISFYQLRPKGTAVSSVSQPTVLVRLTMSAFRPNTRGTGYLEAYREELSTGLTARGIVPGVSGSM